MQKRGAIIPVNGKHRSRPASPESTKLQAGRLFLRTYIPGQKMYCYQAGLPGLLIEPLRFLDQWCQLFPVVGCRASNEHRVLSVLVRNLWRFRISEFVKIPSSAEPGLLIVEAPDRVVHVNARAAQILGRNLTDILGPIPQDARQEIIDIRGKSLQLSDLPATRAIESGRAVEDEILGLRQTDGSVVWFSTSAEPLIRQGTDKPTGAIVILRPVNRMNSGDDPLSKYREWLRWATRIRQVFEFERDFQRNLRSCMELMANASEASSVAYLGFRGGLRSGVLELRESWNYSRGFMKEPRGFARLNLQVEPMRDWLAVLRAAEVLEIGGEEVPLKIRQAMGMETRDRLILGFLLAASPSTDRSQGLIALIRKGDRGAFNPFELDMFRLILSSIANELSRQKAEQAQQRQMTRFRRLFQVTPLIISVMELQGMTLSIVEISNSTSQDREEDLVGRTDEEQGYPEDIREMRRSAARRARKEGRSVRIEYSRPGPDTSVLWEEATFSYLDSHNRSHFFSVAVRDITRDKLEQRQKAQKQKLESMGRFTGSIAHDLNNLLQPPLTYVAETRELLRSLSEIPAANLAVQKLDIALQGLGRSRELVRRLLTFTRQGTSSSGAIDVHSALRSIVDSYAAALPDNVDIHLNVQAKPGFVGLTESGLEQIVVNLIRNSVRAMGSSGGRIEVTLQNTDSDPRAYILAVEDDGPGIPAQIVERIFEPFYSGHSGSGATGLGLSIVQNLVQEAGGTVEVDSRPGQGTSMRVLLPEVESPRPSQRKLTLDSPANLSLRFCLIDDDPMVARALQSGLESLNQFVSHYSDPDEALISLANGGKADVVVLDQILGDKRGAEFAPRIRKLITGNIIMVSGNPELTPEEAFEAGIDAILTKPVFPDELMAAALTLRSTGS